ncbi:amino acid/polyamine transporter [Chloropicon primus]|nr:amino acid/polyamine transporter [Chloropicon primus]
MGTDSGSITLKDVDLNETGKGVDLERDGTGAQTSSAEADVMRNNNSFHGNGVRQHSSEVLHHEPYLTMRWKAFKRKALVRRRAVPVDTTEGTPLTRGEKSMPNGSTSSPSSNSAPEANGEGGGEPEMKRVLGAWDLIMFGIGGIVGAGVFVLTGVGAHDAAGPAIIVSYLIASFAAGLSALCYTEYAVDMPVAGGAFNYVAIECGELFGWIAGWNLVLEYTLSSAAVGRGFTSYASTMLGFQPDQWRVSFGPLNLDFPGLFMVLAVTALLCYGTKESARFNTIVTAVNVAVILFVIFVGLPECSASDFKPFSPMGLTGVFNGAAIVFFSYVGFDTVATTAEETRNPSRDLPIGIVGSLIVCTILYAAMCAALTGMVYYEDIDVNAPFADAFMRIDMGWATEVVSIGAVTGIVTALLVALLGCARIYTILGRTGLLPPSMSKISKSRGTPINATVITGMSSGLLTFLFDIEILAELVSIGTLFVFSFVAGSIMIKHYGQEVMGKSNIPSLVVRLVVQVALALVMCVLVQAEKWIPVAILALLYGAVIISYYFIPRNQIALKFRVPLIPWVPSLCILCNVYLIGSLGIWAYVRFFIWNFIGVCVYFFYGAIHTSEVLPSQLKSIALVGVRRDSQREDANLLSDSERS